MRHMLVSIVLLVAGIAISVHADLIWFTDGQSIEGYVEIDGEKVRMMDRLQVNVVEFATNRIQSIEMGKWIGPPPTLNRRSATQITNIIGTMHVVNTQRVIYSKVPTQPSRLKMEWPRFNLSHILTGGNWIAIAKVVGTWLLFIPSLVAAMYVIRDACKQGVLIGLQSVFMYAGAVVCALFLMLYDGAAHRRFLVAVPMVMGFVSTMHFTGRRPVIIFWIVFVWVWWCAFTFLV